MALTAIFKTFDALGHILPRCETVFEAFQQVARYSAIASQGAKVCVAADGRSIALSIEEELPKGPLQSCGGLGNPYLCGASNAALPAQAGSTN
jgi:hypothetical protein